MNIEKYEEIQLNNLCPMISMVSSGKSRILNVIFNLNILESKAGIGTKFVSIIRYNPEVKDSPKFYHLKITKNDIDNYSFSKINGSEILGYENIKEKIIELNNELKNNDNVPYDELFYFLEIGNDNFIKDKTFLKSYDLVDIPGVSEYCSQPKSPDDISNEEY